MTAPGQLTLCRTCLHWLHWHWSQGHPQPCARVRPGRATHPGRGSGSFLAFLAFQGTPNRPQTELPFFPNPPEMPK